MWSSSSDANVVQVGTRNGMPLCSCIDTSMRIREIRVVAPDATVLIPCGDYSVFDAPAHGRIVRGVGSPPAALSTWVDEAAQTTCLSAAPDGAVHLQFAACSARDRNAALIVMQHVLHWDVLFGTLGALRTTAPNPNDSLDVFDATLARVADTFGTTTNARRIAQLASMHGLVMRRPAAAI